MPFHHVDYFFNHFDRVSCPGLIGVWCSYLGVNVRRQLFRADCRGKDSTSPYLNCLRVTSGEDVRTSRLDSVQVKVHS